MTLMSNFKDFLAKDISDTFFNANEFAEKLLIEGKEVTIIRDPEQLIKKQFGNGGEGLANAEILFYVPKTELNFRPIANQQIQLGERKFRIISVSSEDEMYVITVGRNQ